MSDNSIYIIFHEWYGGEIVERITIRLDDIEKELLQEYAEDQDTTISQIIRRLIKEFLDEHYER